MSSYGAQSLSNLKGVDPRLVRICIEACKILDHTVVDGVRTPEEQKKFLEMKVSWTLNSKHIPNPRTGYSEAVDLAPYPINWADKEMFCVLAGVMRAVAHAHGIKLRWGGDWNRNDSTRDEKSRDYGHFEIREG